ncbi:hypothetical protein T484DRAFT_1885601, partial [Baffinella frigidus]
MEKGMGSRDWRKGRGRRSASKEDRMKPERLGQLQEFIGGARKKQEKWKTRVSGGTLFKKNQEKSFIESLRTWHDAGILFVHRPEHFSEILAEEAVNPLADPSSHANIEQGGNSSLRGAGEGGAHGLGGVKNEGGGGKAGGGGAVVDGGTVLDDGGKAGGIEVGGGGGEERDAKRQAVVTPDGKVVPHGTGGGGAHSSLGASGDVAAAAGRGAVGDVQGDVEGEQCPIARANRDSHPDGVAGWSVLRRSEWDSARRSWFTNGNESAYKAMSFNMCLRHMGFRPTRGTRY